MSLPRLAPFIFALIMGLAIVVSHSAGAQGVVSNPSTMPSAGSDVDPAQTGAISDGGGSGLACFLSPQIAQAALDDKGRLKESHRGQIRYLMTMDFFEAFWFGAFIRPLSSHESPEAYLNRVVREKIHPLSPLFAAALADALESVSSRFWKSMGPLAAINDRGETLEWEKAVQEMDHCVPVQIVRRIEIGSGPDTRISRIEFDSDLFAKLFSHNLWREAERGRVHPIAGVPTADELGIHNQALMILHEGLYTMARKYGHMNSAKVRRLAHFLLQEGTYNGYFNNFDFLYTLRSTGFLEAALTRIGEENDRARAFVRLMDRLVEYNRNQFLARGIDCRVLESKGTDTTCESGTVGEKYWFPSSQDALFSVEELAKESDALLFLIHSLIFPFNSDKDRTEDLLRRVEDLRFDGSFIEPKRSLFGFRQPESRSSSSLSTVEGTCLNARSLLRIYQRDVEAQPASERQLRPKLLLSAGADRYCRRLMK